MSRRILKSKRNYAFLGDSVILNNPKEFAYSFVDDGISTLLVSVPDDGSDAVVLGSVTSTGDTLAGYWQTYSEGSTVE